VGPRVGPDRLLYERGVIALYTGAIGWRSLFNIAWCVSGWVLVISLELTGKIPLWLGMILAAVFLQACYMPMHESVQRPCQAEDAPWYGLIERSGHWPDGCFVSPSKHTGSHI